MANWTTPPTYTTSQVLAGSDFQAAFVTNPTALAKPPIISSYLTSDQSIPNATWTAVAFAPSLFSNNFGLTSSQFTPSVSVKLRICATLFWAANATGMRGVRIFDNFTSTELAGSFIDAVAGATYTEQSWSGVINTTTSSTIVVQAYQTSGGALNLTSGSAGRTQVQLVSAYWN